MKASVNGIELSYTDEGDGPSLVFVHGFPLSRGCWKPQIEAFRSSHRCIAPDLRGFGDSQATSGAVTMGQYADDLAELIRTLDTGPVVLTAHSMGGYIAFAFAHRHPELLRGLVLVATRAGKDTPEVAQGRRATAESVRSDGIQIVVDAMTPKMLAPGSQDESRLEAVRDFMTPASRDGVIGALLGMADRPDATAQLAEISVPTLVITGDEDIIIDPAESQAMEKAIAGARLQVIPDAGHFVSLEQPEVFNRELRDWLVDSGLAAPA